jgi:hypothetical protein
VTHVSKTQHLKKKLENDSCEVVMAVLRVLSVLATPRSTRQVVCEQPFINKLSALSSIFSGSANGPLSLSACCKDASEEVCILVVLSVFLVFCLSPPFFSSLFFSFFSVG